MNWHGEYDKTFEVFQYEKPMFESFEEFKKKCREI